MKRRFNAVFGVFLALLVLASVSDAPAQTAKGEDANQGWLGVSITDVTSAQAKKLNLKETDGAYVTAVSKKSPAEAAGIKDGDIILEFAGRKIFDADDLSKAVKRTRPETKTSMVVWQEKSKLSLVVTLGTLPAPERSITRSYQQSIPHLAWVSRGGSVGMKLLDLNPQLAEYFGAPDGEGVLVEEVKKVSPAQKAGFKAGDVILRWGNKRVDEARDIQKLVAEGESGESVDVEILRKGSRQKLTVVLEEGKGYGYNFDIFRGGEPRIHIFRDRDGQGHEQWFDFESIEPNMDELNLKMEEMRRKIQEGNLRLREELRDQIRTIRMIKEI